MLLGFHGKQPVIHPTAWLAPPAVAIGDVTLGEGSSLWFGTVVRGDVVPIVIGKRTSIQDVSMIHGSTGRGETTIGDDVTVGHGVILHGCEIRSRCLIGMGAIVLDRAIVGEDAIVAAGALVPEGMIVEPRTMAMAVPAKASRAFTDADLDEIRWAAGVYVEIARAYREGR